MSRRGSCGSAPQSDELDNAHEQSRPFTFFLGTHHPAWLGTAEVPLFVSRRRLSGVRRLPRARVPWALDSGGFSELSLFGRWRTTPAQYVDEVRRFHGEIGRLEWAAIQDWMVEPDIRRQTGLTVREHQARTIENYARLKELGPEIPWAPVLQGWTAGEYLDHLDAYATAGQNLREAPVVGVGSICRRQNTVRAALIIRELFRSSRLPLHGFGLKTQGLLSVSHCLASADSLAWSFNARKNPPLPECAHPRCSNCLRYALEWRDGLVGRINMRQPH